MKKSVSKYLILASVAALFVASGCELDNYEAPDGCVSGNIIDADTGKPIPLPVEGSTGVAVSLLEKGGSLAQTFYAVHDGSFCNSMIFNGKYTVDASGPFITDGGKDINVSGDTFVEIQARPYSRIEFRTDVSGSKAAVSWTVTPDKTGTAVTRTYILWNYRKATDIQPGNYTGSKVFISDKTEGSHTFDFKNESKYAENIDKISGNGGKVYIRVAAECDGYVNYSEVMEIIPNIQ